MITEIKELKINNTVYAKYIIKGEVIFLEMFKNIIPENRVMSENILVLIAKSIEVDSKFERANFLNN